MSESEARALINSLSYSELLQLRELLRLIRAERRDEAEQQAS